MNQQQSSQTASGEALSNIFSNRRGVKIQSGSRTSRAWRATGAFLCASLLLTLFCWTGEQSVKADTNIGNVSAGSSPYAVAVNPVTNKIYVANLSSNNVTVIDGTNNSTTTVATGSGPHAVAVNSITNKIYVANGVSGNVTVIDGTDNSTITITAGKIYYQRFIKALFICSTDAGFIG